MNKPEKIYLLIFPSDKLRNEHNLSCKNKSLINSNKMNSIFRKSNILLTLLLLSAAGFTSCKSKTTVSNPLVTSKDASEIGRGWALINGVVNPENSSVTVSFDWDTTTNYTKNIAAIPATLTGSSATLVYASLTGLKPSTEYFFRLKVTAESGTFYGKDTSFTTSGTNSTFVTFNPDLIYGDMTDIDENVYKTIVIGTQTWMAENLKTTRFSNGQAIDYVPVSTIWTDSTSAAYCWYNADSVIYGALYNWAAVSNGNLCPVGWHVPSDAEWTVLTDYLGGESGSAGKLMETGTVHWNATNVSTTNNSGFTALPGGYRSNQGVYSNIKRYSFWWSSTGYSDLNAWCRQIFYSYDNTTRTNSAKQSGLSVRCVKD
jgi:uncharacterized protein (TIGR02145 family)